MKPFHVVMVILLVAGLLAIGAVFYFAHQDNLANKAQADLDKQLAHRWVTVINSYDLLGKSCGSKKEYKDFCRSHYKTISSLAEFKVDPKYAKDFQPQVEIFASMVIYPAKDLFNLMSEPIVGDPDQLKDILRKAEDLEKDMSQYWENHRQLTPVPQKAKDLKPLLAKIYTPKPPTPPKVVVVYKYPEWIRSDTQRQAFSSMRNITSRYFQARLSLNKQLNWNYGKNNPNYFATSDAQAVLRNAIELRKNLYAEVQEAKQAEGMSELGEQLETMLRNSYQGLMALYNDQDYATFKSYNNQNDSISRYVHQAFGIR